MTSLPTNIAEGSARETKKDYLHFLYIARGSLSETQYLVHLAARLGYVNESDAESVSAQIQQAFRRLHGLIRAVESEAGKLARTIATVTSLVALFTARGTFGVDVHG